MDPVGDLALLASPDPRARLAAEGRLKAAGPAGIEALTRLLRCDPLPAGFRARASELLGSILHETALAAFTRAVPDPQAPDLWAGAVAIAAEGHPGLDAAAIDGRLEALVVGAQAAAPAGAPVPDRAQRLTRWLFEEQGFHGDVAAYGDLRNSYLPDVLERRLGIPVTLSVLWMTLAKRLGMSVAGVGLPLHFVARCEGEDGPFYVDAFHGTVLDREGCRQLVARAAGREVSLPDRAFQPLRPGEVLTRILRNLRASHERSGNLFGALAAVDRILHLSPLDPAGWRERALLLARISRPAAAARSLSRSMALDPAAGDRPVLEGLRRRLQREAAERN